MRHIDLVLVWSESVNLVGGSFSFDLTVCESTEFEGLFGCGRFCRWVCWNRWLVNCRERVPELDVSYVRVGDIGRRNRIIYRISESGTVQVVVVSCSFSVFYMMEDVSLALCTLPFSSFSILDPHFIMICTQINGNVHSFRDCVSTGPHP